jgi:poly(3-hydroxybutyrate) depolymerase
MRTQVKQFKNRQVFGFDSDAPTTEAVALLLWCSAKIFTNPTKPNGRSKSSVRCSMFRVLFALLLFLAAATVPAREQPFATLQFAGTGFTVAEVAGAVTLTVQRSDDTNTVVSVDYATADGTAMAGLKYTAVSGTLTFAAEETIKTILVPILNEGFVEGMQFFKVILGNPTGGAVLGVDTNATVAIADSDVGMNFQFVSYSVVEDAGAVLIGVVRGDDGTLPVTVDWATGDLTATNGLDYVGLTNTLAFGPTERLKFVSVPILNNSLKQPNRAFRLSLSHPTGGTLGNTTTTTVTILDIDPGFQFELASYTVAEDAGAVLIRVLRGSDQDFPATVNYATEDVTATNGLDYTATQGTLAFAPAEKVKLVSVPILNDGANEPSKTFRVLLSNPVDGVLGPQTTTTVAILDNDPGLGFELSNYSVCEKKKASEIVVTVVRGNDVALGPITVDYATADGSATAGNDYQAVSGTIGFQENETVKSLTVPILQPPPTGATKSFQVILTNPTGGATLGTATTTVNILENYPTITPPIDARLAIRREGGVNLLTWTEGGQLQRADRVTGPWQTLAAARSPWPVQSAVPATFYQVTSSRPVSLHVPSSYDGHTPMPLVILLHGYTYSGDVMEYWLAFQPLAEQRGLLYCHPDGTIDRWGYRFWNGADSCCDFWNTGVDDAGYLRGVIEEIARQFVVDRKRIYLIGYSSGGWMAYRMACESPDLIAGLASLNGMTFLEPTSCHPSQPVNILHIHGTADTDVSYYGGVLGTQGLAFKFPANLAPFPGAMRTVQIWAGYNGCSSPVTEAAPSMDLDQKVAGLDTVVTRYTNYPPGGAVELWTINGGTHLPRPSSELSPRIIDWLLAHPKP